VASGEKVILAEDTEGLPVFKTGGGSSECFCDELTGEDFYDQLSQYCDVDNIDLVLPYSKQLTFQVLTDDPVLFKLTFFDATPPSTSVIGTSEQFAVDIGAGQEVDMDTGLTGSIEEVASGTLQDPVSVSVVESGDSNNVISGYGGITNLAFSLENDTFFQVHLVDDGGGFWHIDIYDSIGSGTGGTKLMHTASFSTTGDKAIIPDVGIFGGTITVDALGPATTSIQIAFVKTGDPDDELLGFNIEDLWSKGKETTWLTKETVNDFYVRIYSGSCLIGHTVPGTETGDLTVVPDTPAGGWPCPALGGTIHVDRWLVQDSKIVIECTSGECCGADCSKTDVVEKCSFTVDWDRDWET
jgi:hypothetical protein